MEVEEKEFIQKTIRYCKKHRSKCKDWCMAFDWEHNECGIYGEYKDTPSTCKYFLSHIYDDWKNNLIKDEAIEDILNEK